MSVKEECKWPEAKRRTPNCRETVAHTPSLSIMYDSWGDCYSNLTGACDMDYTGITDYAACMQDLDTAQCVDITGNQGIELPPTCWQAQ